MACDWGHNQLGVFVLNCAPQSRMKEGTRRVNWNSAMRRMMSPRLVGIRAACWSAKEEGDDGGKRIEEESREESSIQGIFTAIFFTTYPQIHCLKL